MKHQLDGISVGAMRTSKQVNVTCQFCGQRYQLNSVHYCDTESTEYYDPRATLRPPPRPPRRKKEGGC